MKARSRWPSVAAFATASLCSALASADDEVCRRAYVETQRLQRAAQFRAAIRQAVTCGQDVCSATVRSQCTTWLESIERALPTLVVDARDGAGVSLAEVRVEANGELLAERLNGRALELDPGEYVLSFRYREQVVEQRTLIRESEKYRTVEVRFGALPEPPAAAIESDPSRAAASPSAASPSAAAPPAVVAPVVSGAADIASSPGAPLPSDTRARQAPEPVPRASYLLGGLGAASLATFVVLATSGYAAERHLRKTCVGACTSDAVDSVRARYVLADVALGVGVSSLLAAGAIWIWAPGEPSATSRLSLGPHSVAFEGEF